MITVFHTHSYESGVSPDVEAAICLCVDCRAFRTTQTVYRKIIKYQ